MSIGISEIFTKYQEHLTSEQDLREEIRLVVRDLEHTAREVLAIIQGIHQPEGTEQVKNVCTKARALFDTAKTQYDTLQTKIPKDQYYRFHDHWRFATQRFVFLCAMVVYLESEKLLNRDELTPMLGLHVNPEQGFHIDLDDYLMGLLALSNELSRYAVNSVTAGDYERPIRISRFMNEINGGFRLLNLKNDGLRKKYDGLKYDIKKVEEVVYDLSIRGLKADGKATTGAAEGQAAVGDNV